MTGEIDQYGQLHIHRNVLELQYCPFKNNTCDDTCPLFQEDQIAIKLHVSLNCASQKTLILITKDERK